MWKLLFSGGELTSGGGDKNLVGESNWWGGGGGARQPCNIAYVFFSLFAREKWNFYNT